jgi:hypothetical protein
MALPEGVRKFRPWDENLEGRASSARAAKGGREGCTVPNAATVPVKAP